jgi:hypothetical protein
MSSAKAEITINFESLLKQGFGVIDARYKEYEVTDENFKFIIVQVERERDDFYQNMLQNYLGQKGKVKNIYELWIQILQHKLNMSKMLNRDISIKVAALDFMETQK